MRDDPFHGSPYFRWRAFYLRAAADARADAQRCRARSDSTTTSPPAVLSPRRQKDSSHAHMLTALAEVNDERWYLCGKAAVLGVRVKRRLMSEHPGRYGRVSPARILELLPNGGSGRRYKEDLLFTTHEIDRKIVGSEGGAWFGAVRDRPAPARSAPAVGADEQLQLQQLLGRSRDPVTKNVYSSTLLATAKA